MNRVPTELVFEVAAAGDSAARRTRWHVPASGRYRVVPLGLPAHFKYNIRAYIVNSIRTDSATLLEEFSYFSPEIVRPSPAPDGAGPRQEKRSCSHSPKMDLPDFSRVE
jgi:hypothetical protein